MKILIPFADGFEEIEAVTNVDVLRRVGIEVISVTLNNKIVKGAHNIEFLTDCHISEINIEDFDGIILPGGMPGATNLRESKEVLNILKELDRKNKLIAAICAAPIVLKEADIIENINITSFPGFEDELKSGNYLRERVVVDGNVITGRGPGVTLEFAIAIVDYLLGDNVSKKVKKDMIVNF